MNYPAASLAPLSRAAGAATSSLSWSATWVLLLAAAGIPWSLLWDFSWESTVGIDQVWAPAHVASYLAVALSGITSLTLIFITTRTPAMHGCAVRIGPFHGPLGAWWAAWGALAFPAAFLFDRWWQSAYGMAAGIWHPPQILKTAAFFAVVAGAWLTCLNWQNRSTREVPGGPAAFAVSGGLVLALISIVTLASIYPNHQHSASFYKLACGTYPVVLTALATAGKLRWPATTAAAVYTALICSTVWLLPLFPAKPQVAPIYNPLDHLMPPPFPLLLIVPAAALDALLRKVPWPTSRARLWLQAGAAGLVFFTAFAGSQSLFAEFLLSDLSDNRFFAGGGRHWPFFLKIDPLARVSFWSNEQNELNFSGGLLSVGLATLAAGLGLWIGSWMKRVQR